MTTLAIIQARSGSSRFPGKVTADLCGRPLIAHVVERAQAIAGVDRVVLACPAHDEERFASLSLGCDLVAHTGGFGEDDVLTRFGAVLDRYPADYVVRLTGDNPLLAPDLAASVLALVAEEPDEVGYACSRYDGGDSGWPNGLDVEAFRASLLQHADRHATTFHDRHHVTPWLRAHSAYTVLPCAVTWPEGISMTVDTPADLERVAGILRRIPAGKFSWPFTWLAVGPA